MILRVFFCAQCSCSSINNVYSVLPASSCRLWKNVYWEFSDRRFKQSKLISLSKPLHDRASGIQRRLFYNQCHGVTPQLSLPLCPLDAPPCLCELAIYIIGSLPIQNLKFSMFTNTRKDWVSLSYAKFAHLVRNHAKFAHRKMQNLHTKTWQCNICMV